LSFLLRLFWINLDRDWFSYLQLAHSAQLTDWIFAGLHRAILVLSLIWWVTLFVEQIPRSFNLFCLFCNDAVEDQHLVAAGTQRAPHRPTQGRPAWLGLPAGRLARGRGRASRRPRLRRHLLVPLVDPSRG